MQDFTSRLDDFHQAASDACGWYDFGGNEYQPGLQVLLQALDINPPTTELARQSITQTIIGVLVGRLYSEHFKKQYPEYAQQSISRPLFIIGLPRSGTTALQKILAADPKNQGLEYWLGQTPMPRPAKEKWAALPEYQSCSQQLSMIAQAAPEMMAIHEMAADQADECRLLLMQSFANVTFQSNAWVPQYEEWLYNADFKSVYKRYRQNLQLIGLHDKRRWILKDPSHLWSPVDLLEAFPDACIIQTHRHPKRLIPSVSSLVYTSRKMTDPSVDKKQVGLRELKQWSRVLNNLTALRKQKQNLPIYDVRMEDLQSKPLETIENIYHHFSIENDSASLQAMQQWSDSRPPGAHGPHNYTASEFGLTDELIEEHFDEYIEFLSAL